MQRIDSLQAELNTTNADKAAAEAAAVVAEAAAAESRDQATQLQSNLGQVKRQVEMMSSSKDTELQRLHAELAEAINAKTGLELKVGAAGGSRNACQWLTAG